MGLQKVNLLPKLVVISMLEPIKETSTGLGYFNESNNYIEEMCYHNVVLCKITHFLKESRLYIGKTLNLRLNS